MKTKKLLALVLVLVMVCGMLPSLALADGDEAPGGEAVQETVVNNDKADKSGKLLSVTISNVDVYSTSFDADANTLTVTLDPDTEYGTTAVAQFHFEGNDTYSGWPNVGTIDPKTDAKGATTEVNKLKGKIETKIFAKRTEQLVYAYQQKKISKI